MEFNTYVFYYLWACIGLGIGLMSIFAYDDIVKGPDPKFGYNYKSGISWAMLFIVACPIINIGVLVWWNVAVFLRSREGK